MEERWIFLYFGCTVFVWDSSIPISALVALVWLCVFKCHQYLSATKSAEWFRSLVTWHAFLQFWSFLQCLAFCLTILTWTRNGEYRWCYFKLLQWDGRTFFINCFDQIQSNEIRSDNIKSNDGEIYQKNCSCVCRYCCWGTIISNPTRLN